MTQKITLHTGLEGRSVMPEMIESLIVSEHYFTADDAAGTEGSRARYTSPHDLTASLEALKLLTFCVVVLRNGFTVTGESACVSPDNFDPEIGRDIARRNALAKVWPLEGYRLKQALSDDRQRTDLTNV